jgi:glycosyltransferase involved in cell wall biosynthesis
VKKPFISVIVPCYNEEANLKRGVLKQIFEFMRTEKFVWEVIISDDGSTDNSREIIKDQIKNFDNFRLVENKHGGKPSALWHGIREAKGEYVLFCDMDQSTPVSELNKLIPFLGKNVGAVIGSRGLVRKNFPVYRKMGSIIFMAFRKLLILPEIDDTQCGFKIFKRKIALEAFPKLDFFKKNKEVKGWAVTSWDVEILHVVKKMGYVIEEVPVLWEDVDVSQSKGGSLKRYLKESKDMLFQIIRVKLNERAGLYD